MKNTSFFAALTFLCFASCMQEEAVPTPAPEVSEQQLLIAEEAFPGQTASVEKGFLFNQPIEYSRIGKEAVFQGDILLTAEQLTDTQYSGARGTGRTNLPSRWPNNIVYYSIDPNLPDQLRVTEAIAHWEATTTIRFEKRTTQTNYVYFMNGNGCYSYMGMIGGAQDISVGSGCTTGSTIHEIGHALGLWHEQSRSDRDQHLLIHTANIEPGREHNFHTYTQQGQDGFDHGAFDFGSIMMYHPYSFSINGQPTITRKDGSLYTIQRDALSAGDKAIINYMYKAAPVTVVESDINKVIAFYNTGMKDGLLVNAGNKKTADKRLKAFVAALQKAKTLLDADKADAACRELRAIAKKIHTGGKLHPTHVITGEGAPAFLTMISDLRSELGCK